MKRITLNYDGIKKNSSLMNNYSQAIDVELERLKSVIDRLDSVWKGEDSKAFTRLLSTKYVVGLEKLKKNLEDNSTYLNKVVRNFEDVDNEFSNR